MAEEKKKKKKVPFLMRIFKKDPRKPVPKGAKSVSGLKGRKALLEEAAAPVKKK